MFIVVKRGDYDAILPWPLKKKVTFTLIDQQEDPNQKENVTTEFITGDHPHNYKRPLEEESAGIVLIWARILKIIIIITIIIIIIITIIIIIIIIITIIVTKAV